MRVLPFFDQWMKQWKKAQKFFLDPVWQMYGLAGVVFACGALLLLWFSYPIARGVFLRGSDVQTEQPKQREESILPCPYRQFLNGVCVGSEADQSSQLIGVVIENNLEAWPISGLSRASVVYEAPVEGNIPRFLALYAADAEVGEAGPVRSARPYIVDWISEYPGAAFFHVGGSNDALNGIRDYRLFDVNEMIRGWYFWRDEERRAPHNTYTSSQLWRKAVADYGRAHPSASFTAWVFEEFAPCNASCIDSLVTGFGGSGYSAEWRYNADTNRYERYQIDTVAQTDTDGTIIAADTVIVQRVRSRVLDELGRLRIDTTGRGPALILRAGVATAGQWRKASFDARTDWADADGNPITLKAGKIWIEVIPQDGFVSTTTIRSLPQRSL